MNETELKNELKETINILMDVLCQACESNNEVDNMCLRSYEDACNLLERYDLLQKINDREYKVIKYELEWGGMMDMDIFKY